MKQTAVEWFTEKIDNLIPYMDEKTANLFNELVVQAKQMEHAQRVDDYTTGYIHRNSNNFQPPISHDQQTN